MMDQTSPDPTDFRTTIKLYSHTTYDNYVSATCPSLHNPTLDLSATWDASEQSFLIYRPPDEVVSRFRHQVAPGGEDAELQAFAWKPDGKLIAGCWSDGSVRIMAPEASKPVHVLQLSSDAAPAGNAQPRFTHIDWVVGHAPHGFRRTSSNGWQKFLDASGLGLEPDHPVSALLARAQLTEPEAFIPKLRPLPLSSAGPGDEAMLFCRPGRLKYLDSPLRTSIDLEKSICFDMMFAGTDDSRVHLYICDFFFVGAFPISAEVQAPPTGSPPSAPARPHFVLTRHVSHPDVTTQVLYLRLSETPSAGEDPAGSTDDVFLMPMDLGFVVSLPIKVNILVPKLTRLQNLLRYLHQTCLHMRAELRNAREYPSKLVASLQEDLAGTEEGAVGAVDTLWQVVLMGCPSKVTKEWLTEVVGERGYKRWGKAVTGGLRNLCTLVTRHLHRVVNHILVIASRLAGLGAFHGSMGTATGFTSAHAHGVENIAKLLFIVGHRILRNAMDELILFEDFALWLRYIIVDAFKKTSEEAPEPDFEIGNVITYVKKYLAPEGKCARDSLELHLSELPDAEMATDIDELAADMPLPDFLDGQLANFEREGTCVRAVPNIAFLVAQLGKRSEVIFSGITEELKQGVRLCGATRLAIGRPVSAMAGAVIPHQDEDHTYGYAYTAMASKECEAQLYIFRTKMWRADDGMGAPTTTEVCRLEFPPGWSIHHLNFRNHERLLALVYTPKHPWKVVQITVDGRLDFVPYDSNGPMPDCQIVSTNDPADGPNCKVMYLPTDFKGVPARMDVHPATSKKEKMPLRVCLLEENKFKCSVFAVPGGPMGDANTEPDANPRGCQ